MTIEWKKTKRALAILLAMVMLLGQAELILPHASAAGIEDEAQQSGEPDQAPSEDADGGVGAPGYSHERSGRSRRRPDRDVKHSA